MAVYSLGEMLVAGVRCQYCDRFYAVAEGSAICYCWHLNRHPEAGMALEHHTTARVRHCGVACACACHEYRKRGDGVCPGEPLCPH